jgi:WD40 repeat protein
MIRMTAVAVGCAAVLAPSAVQAAAGGPGTDTPGAVAVRASSLLPGTMMWSAQVSGGDATDVAANPRYPIVYVTGWTATSRHEPGHPRFLIDDFTTVAYNTKTGAQLWTTSYEGSGFLGQARPLVAVSPNGLRVIVAGDQCLGETYCFVHGYPYGIGQTVLGYDALTGAQLWVTAPPFGPPPTHLAVSPDGSQVFLTGFERSGGYVTSAFSASSGTQEWTVFSILTPHRVHYQFPSALAVSPDNSTVFVTGTQGTIALEARGAGATLWERHSAGAVAKSLAVSHDSSVLLAAGCDARPQLHPLCTSNALTAFNAATGMKLWSLPDGADQVVASPAGPQMFVGAEQSGSPVLAAYDVASGVHTKLWQTATIAGQVLVSRNGQAVFVVGTNTIAAYNPSSGAELFSVGYSYPGSSPVIAVSGNGSKLFITGDDNGGYLTAAYRL